MKPFSRLLIFLFLLTAIISCERKNNSCPACGIENPMENLPWLKATKMLYYATDDQSLTKIDLYEYDSKQLILFTWSLKGPYDLPTGAIYNCNGEVLYNCGGNQPFDSCTYVIDNSKYIGNIWTK